jgi:hypothetical protein
MKKFGCSIVVIVVSLSMAGCVIPAPEQSILAGVWTVTPAEPGDFADWDYEATFSNTGKLVELSAERSDGAVVELEIDNATSQVSGSTVTVTIPNAAGTRVFEGTLSADQNTMTGSMTEYIDFGDLEARLPGGELTLQRVPS